MFIFEYDPTSKSAQNIMLTDRHSHRQTCRQAHKYSIVVIMKCHLPLHQKFIMHWLIHRLNVKLLALYQVK